MAIRYWFLLFHSFACLFLFLVVKYWQDSLSTKTVSHHLSNSEVPQMSPNIRMIVCHFEEFISISKKQFNNLFSENPFDNCLSMKKKKYYVLINKNIWRIYIFEIFGPHTTTGHVKNLKIYYQFKWMMKKKTKT